MNIHMDGENMSRATDFTARTSARQWWLVIVLSVIAMLGAMDRQILSLLSMPIKADLHLTDTQFSVAYGGAVALTDILLLLPAGFLADRGRRRLLLGLGVVTWSLLTVVCGIASSFGELIAARAGVGVGESVLQPVSASLLKSGSNPQGRGRAFSIFAMGNAAGSALALLLGGLLMQGFGRGSLFGLSLAPWRQVMLVLALGGIPIALLLMTVSNPPLAPPKATGRPGYRQAIGFIIRSRRLFIPLFVFNTAVGMVTLSYGAWIAPVAMRNWGLSVSHAGIVLGLMMLALPPVGLAIIGPVMDRTTRRFGVRGPALVAAPAIILFGVIHALCPLSRTEPLFWTSLALLLTISRSCVPVTNTIISLVAPEALVGKITAVQYMLYSLVGATGGPMMVALVSERFFGGARAIGTALGLVSGVCAAVALVAILAVERELRRAGR